LQSGRTWDRVGLAHIVSIVIRTAVSPVLFALHEPRLDRIGLDVVDDRTQLGMVANVACGRDARGPSDTGVRPAKGGGMSIMALWMMTATRDCPMTNEPESGACPALGLDKGKNDRKNSCCRPVRRRRRAVQRSTKPPHRSIVLFFSFLIHRRRIGYAFLVSILK